MTQFRPDNTEGFTAAELATMNDEYHHNLTLALEALPGGAQDASDDTLAQIRQSTAEAVLRRHGAA
jgi:hypothetical protein